MTPSDVHYAKSGDGTQLAYDVTGHGPPLLFVPPGVSHLELKWDEPGYARLLRSFASFARLITMDKRGCGLSDRSAALPTAEEQVEDIGAVLDDAGVERAWLLGIADGGASCLLFAAHHPERVHGVITWGSVAFAVVAADNQAGISPEAIEVMTRVIELGDPTASLPLLAPSKNGDESFARWWARYQRSSSSPRDLARWTRQILQLDLRDVLGSVSVPVLSLNRTDNLVVAGELARDLVDRLPDARLVELAGHDFMPFIGDIDPVITEVEQFIVGTKTAVETDRVLASVVFTDIVGSTQMAADKGDQQWASLLERHDSITSAAVAQHRGEVIKSTGDGALLSFNGPARAVRCALQLASEVRTLDLEIRAGVHTGEVVQRGGDVGGMAVHIAARVQALADPGEVLVSRTVTDLVTGSELAFDHRGQYALKGVPGEWELYTTVSPH